MLNIDISINGKIDLLQAVVGMITLTKSAITTNKVFSPLKYVQEGNSSLEKGEKCLVL